MKFTDKTIATVDGFCMVEKTITRMAEYDKEGNATGKYVGGRVIVRNTEMEQVIVNLPNEISDYTQDDRNALQEQGIILCARFSGFKSSNFKRTVGRDTVYYATAEAVEFKQFALKEVDENG